jgi:hypothetical protein
MLRALVFLCVPLLLAACAGGADQPTSTPAASASAGLSSPQITGSPSSGPTPLATDGAAVVAPTPAPTSTPAPTVTPAPASAPSPTSAPGTSPGATPSTTPSPTATPSPSATPGASAVPRPDRWVKAGRFTKPRQDTQMARLGNGQVLAVGDEATCGIESSASDSAELWRPRTSRWSATDDVPSKRTMTTLIALSDGRAMVTGGATAEYVAKSSTAVYDPRRHRWAVSGLLHTARMEFAAAPLPDGGVIVAGGLLIDAHQNGRALRSAERWNPKTGRWTEIAPLASVRMGAVAVTLDDGRVLVVGGFPSWGADRPLATAEIYNPRTGRWRSAGKLAGARSAFALIALPGGGALVVGGAGGETRAELFDPDARTWSVVRGAAPVGEQPAAAVLQDGRVLVVSGRTAKLYHPASHRWSRTVSLPGGMWNASAVLLSDGSVLVGGGWTRAARDGEAPGCPGYSSRTWRFVPGS